MNGWVWILPWLLACTLSSTWGNSEENGQSNRYCTEYEIRDVHMSYEKVFANGLAALHGKERESDIDEALRCFLCATRSDTALKFDAYRQLGELHLQRGKDYIGFAKYYLIKALQNRNHGGVQRQREVDILMKLLEVYLIEGSDQNDIDMTKRSIIGARFYRELIQIKEKRLRELRRKSDTISMDGTIDEENEIHRVYSVDSSHSSLDSIDCDGVQHLLSGHEDTSLVLLYNYHVSAVDLPHATHKIESYELFISKLSNMLASCRNEGNTNIHGYTDEKDFFRISAKIQELRGGIEWPQNKPVKILFDDIYGDPVFGETVKGLTSALISLGIPSKVVTYVEEKDDSLYILMFASSEAMKATNYIYWNMEKNPTVVRPSEKPALKSFSNNYLETAAFPPDIIYRATAVLDYSIHHLTSWNDIFTTFGVTYYLDYMKNRKLTFQSDYTYVNVVRPLVSPDLIQAAVVENNFMHDDLLPIDIALFGNINPHRQAMYNKLGKLAQEKGLRVEFHRKLYGSQRDAIMDSAKIILNLGNHPIPHETGSFRRSAANLHRIMYPLARGKVVLSELSGISVDETLFEGIVTFANSTNLVEVAWELLLDINKRRQLERKAIAFMKRELGLSNEDDGYVELLGHMSKLSSLNALGQIMNYAKGTIWHVYTKNKDAPPSSFSAESTCMAPYDSYDEGVECFLQQENINGYLDRYRIDTDVSVSLDNLSRKLDIYRLLEHITLFDPTRPFIQKEFRREYSEEDRRDVMEAVSTLKLSEVLFIHETHSKNDCVIKALDHEVWFLVGGMLEELVLYNDKNVDNPLDVVAIDIDWGVLAVMKRLSSAPKIQKDWSTFPNLRKIRLPAEIDRAVPLLSIHELYDWMAMHGVRA